MRSGESGPRQVLPGVRIAARQPEPVPEEERKVVTAPFNDIVGSTARKFIGDAAVALFGAPAAHEDDTERAVPRGARHHRCDRRVNEEDAWLDLHLRTAAHTGEALVIGGVSAVEGLGMAAGDVMTQPLACRVAPRWTGSWSGRRPPRDRVCDRVPREAEPQRGAFASFARTTA